MNQIGRLKYAILRKPKAGMKKCMRMGGMRMEEFINVMLHATAATSAGRRRTF
eukprot:CAMPEP_0113231176 /NCGR_PEP_ID=MMETSP0008_2-20120614/1286_1 /TAXON_ID=97485 /ORGANISM="Prymnesium parvum" /LENGTH=52 /DNA_ID=CAMNT_0000077825 /DNA_START=149 /DNA_END=307 /DNA_ORIENTATION=+ /assembly_acc=CAM_ASM_000153